MDFAKRSDVRPKISALRCVFTVQPLRLLSVFHCVSTVLAAEFLPLARKCRLDLLAEGGYDYNLDWCHDDQPTWMACRDGGR